MEHAVGIWSLDSDDACISKDVALKDPALERREAFISGNDYAYRTWRLLSSALSVVICSDD
jgi:hypothetical protein